MTAIGLQPGQRLIVVAVDPNLKPTHPIVIPPEPPPVDPNAPKPSHPIALPGDPWFPVTPPPVDPNAPKPTHPIMLPGMPGWPTDPPPVEPPVEPPSGGGGRYVWAWSPQLDRWIWVRIPGPGEAGPKK